MLMYNITINGTVVLGVNSYTERLRNRLDEHNLTKVVHELVAVIVTNSPLSEYAYLMSIAIDTLQLADSKGNILIDAPSGYYTGVRDILIDKDDSLIDASLNAVYMTISNEN